MTSIASPHAPAHTRSPPSSPLSPTRGKSLVDKMMDRYFSLPQVSAWLLNREPRLAQNAHALNTSFSYACMYYPPSSIPPGMDRYPVQEPFLDIGDVLLCHHVYDGVAVGTLFNKKEEHALAFVRDSMLHTTRLSRRPRTRNFAVDLRVKQLEVIEFAWMEDDSLIIACRRLVDSNSTERKFVLSSDMLFFEPIPRHLRPEKRFMLLSLTLREKTVVCDFCGVQGYQSCTCPNSLKRKAPTPYIHYSDAEVPTRDRRNEPTGPLSTAIGSWENYMNTVFSCSQTGSFFISSRRRTASGAMKAFSASKHPIQYRFVCGHKNDTNALAALYIRKMRLCEREFAADTLLYGGGLSRGSDLGMIMDKDDEDPQQQMDFLAPEGAVSIFRENDALSCGFVSHLGTDTRLLSQASPSQVTIPTDEYGQFFSQIEMSRPMVQVQSQCAEEASLLSTRPSHGSPSSTLLDREEPFVTSSLMNMHEVRANRSRHVMHNAYEEWNETQTPLPISSLQVPSQPRPLSTTSRELQAFMTVDEAGTPKCSECGNSFQKRGNLARHVQTVHLKLKPFQCDQCPARFGYKTHLKRHKSVHLRGSEFRCHICHRDFRGQVKLNRHMFHAHDQETGHLEREKNITCDTCGEIKSVPTHANTYGPSNFCPTCLDRLVSFKQISTISNDKCIASIQAIQMPWPPVSYPRGLER